MVCANAVVVTVDRYDAAALSSTSKAGGVIAGEMLALQHVHSAEGSDARQRLFMILCSPAAGIEIITLKGCRVSLTSTAQQLCSLFSQLGLHVYATKTLSCLRGVLLS